MKGINATMEKEYIKSKKYSSNGKNTYFTFYMRV